MNTNRVKAMISGIVGGALGFINWLATVPPEQQSGILGQLVEIVPLTWRPAVGLITRLLMYYFSVLAIYKATHSGPSQQQNQTNETK